MPGQNRVPQQNRVLVIRHETCSELGLLENQLRQNTIPFRYLDTVLGETLTEPITDYSHLIILGGAMSAFEDEEYPFLRYEFGLIEGAIAQGVPTLGICLGSQILAKVLGAKVYRGENGREAGWCEVKLMPTAQHDPIFQVLPDQFNVFQSHQDTFEIPPKCVRLAWSDRYPNQAFRYQQHVWAIQFHLEMNEAALRSCGAVIEKELEDSQIEDTTLEQMLAEARYHTPFVQPLADQFMQQFIDLPQSIAV
ncbi:MAG: type 1 glutamine amidotransferase [Oculatellaceae cyanobacterium bins.114]|nr:type 1 glutamine amidotransferase [Oculatellaceae cyanobacterium bins.114]